MFKDLIERIKRVNKLRNILEFKDQGKVEVDREQEIVKIKNIPDLSEVKGMVKNPKQGVLEVREKMEKEYQP